MSDIVKFEDGAHWYAVDGTPAYTRLTKDGKERKTTLRDARKENLVPSVTTVNKLIANEFLQRWKLENLLTAALTLPQNQDEDVQAFAQRVWQDSNTIVEGAMNFGTEMHDAIEIRLRLGSQDGMVIRSEIAPHFELVERWISTNVSIFDDAEFSVVGKEGYAGRVDALVEHKEHGPCLVDWKTQNVRKKPNFYDTWVRQLAAYRHAAKLKCRLLSVVISSNDPMDPVEKLWEEDECERALEVFLQTLRLWQLINKYKPKL